MRLHLVKLLRHTVEFFPAAIPFFRTRVVARLNFLNLRHELFDVL
jgi:hypothetical protein